MPDPWMTESDITGNWSGHYSHRVGPDCDRQYAISAVLECRDGRIIGTMTDAMTRIRRSYKDIAHAAAERWSRLQLAVAYRFLDANPMAVLESILPRESD